MADQTEAQRLADELERRFPKSGKNAAAELRRQETVIAQLLEALELEMSDKWECNSYHPKLIAAIAAAKGEA